MPNFNHMIALLNDISVKVTELLDRAKKEEPKPKEKKK